MKLRNKKTGEIGYLYEHSLVQDIIIVYDVKGIVGKYNSLAELNAEWEDVPEEPKEYYFIRDDGSGVGYSPIGNSTVAKRREVIGNCFDNEEEAELAVRKLKAWKRLKDKGFRFNRWTIPEEPKTPHIKLVIEAEVDVPDSPYDLDLLFGGEE